MLLSILARGEDAFPCPTPGAGCSSPADSARRSRTVELSFHLAHEELALQQGRGVRGTPTAATALGTGLAELWMSPVPGQLSWECARLTHHIPAPCSGSLPWQQGETCSHSLLNRCILWAGSWLLEFGAGRGEKGVLGCQGVLILQDCPQTLQAGLAATARPGLGCVDRLCKGTSFAFLPAGKKVTYFTFFHP